MKTLSSRMSFVYLLLIISLATLFTATLIISLTNYNAQVDVNNQGELLKILGSNRELLNIIGNQSMHIDQITNHTDSLIIKNYKDILINRHIQLDILGNLSKIIPK